MQNSQNTIFRLLARIEFFFSGFTLDKTFFREAFLANFIIGLTLIPQFLIVPLILQNWGEAEYSGYIIFLSIVNLIGSVNVALHYGFVHRLFIKGEMSQNAIFSMAAINLLCLGLLCFVLLIIFAFLEFETHPQHIKYLLIITPFVLVLGSIKAVYQLGFSLISPLIISLLQSVVTFLLLFGASFSLLPKGLSLLALVSLATAIVTVFIGLNLWSRRKRFTFIFDFNCSNFKNIMIFLLRFGGVSFLISLINNLYLNGTKIYLGSAHTTRLLVDFNLTFSMCVISVQFLSPVIGLIFPYLTKLDSKGVGEFRWILNLHKIYWLLSSLIFSGYLLLSGFLIKYWIGASYLYLREFVLVLLFYFLLNEGSSIFVQFFKRLDKQSSTLILSCLSFILIPFFSFSFLPSLDLIQLCLIFNTMALFFYVCITIVAFIKFDMALKGSYQMFLDGLVGCSVIFLLYWLDTVVDSWVEVTFVSIILFFHVLYFFGFDKFTKKYK